MNSDSTTLVVQQYLDRLADVRGEELVEPVVAALLARSADRLRMLCTGMLQRSYPRLTRGPLNLVPDEMLGAIVERLIKALRQVRPQTVRQFFALANQHIRWELNDLARRLDERELPCELRESFIAAPAAGEGDSAFATTTTNLSRILQAIEDLPDDEREAFNLLRIQGLTQPEAAAVLGVSAKTVKRRLDRGLMLLSEKLLDLQSAGRQAPVPADSPSSII